MGIQEDRFSTDEQHRTKDSPLMKIIATAAFGGVGLFFVFAVMLFYKSLGISLAIVLVFGFIILTIWLKNLYVYRYLIPGIIIIAVFLAYPLVYTVYIAFTNFGTGHMETRGGLRNYLLTSMFYDSKGEPSESLYSEIYINGGTERQLSKFLQDEYNNYLAKKKASKKGEFTGDDEDDAYYTFYDLDNNDSPINRLLRKSKFSRMRKSDLTLILYTRKEVGADETADAYYFVPTKDFKKIALSDVNKLTVDKGLVLISSIRYRRSGVKELDELLDPYLGSILLGESVTVEDEESGKKTIFSFSNGTVFANRKPLYIDPKLPVENPIVAHIKKLPMTEITEKDGNVLLKLVKNSKTSELEYTKKVFEDMRQGNYVETVKDQPVKYWKEYYVRPNIMKFTYGQFSLENNPGMEKFLAKEITGYTRRLKDIETIIKDTVTEEFDRDALSAYIDGKLDLYNSDPVLDYVDYDKMYSDTINEAMDIVSSSIVVNQPKGGKEATDTDALISGYTKTVKKEFADKLETPICIDEEVAHIITYDKKVCYKPKADVDAADVEVLRSQIKQANKLVGDFNKKIKTTYKNEYVLYATVKALNDSFNSGSFPLNPMNSNEGSEINETVYKFSAVNDSGKVVINVYAADDPTVQIGSVKYSKFKKYLENELKIGRGKLRAVSRFLSKTISKNVSYKMPKIVSFKFRTVEGSNVVSTLDKGFSIWVGAKNFTKIITTPNITTPFFNVFAWTILWALGSVLFSFAVGLALALLFNSSDFKFRTIYRTILILPWAIPAFVSILMWGGLLNKDFGVINHMFNIDVNWLGDQRAWGALPKISTLLVNLWLSFPYFMVISLGALQSIDRSLYEVADVDGATKFQQFRMITLPLLLIAIGPMLVGSFAFSFNNFAGIYLLTGGGPVMRAGVLPGHTDILISYTYKLAFGAQNKDYGLASAIAIFVFLIIGTITFLNFKWTGTFKEVENA